MESIQLWCQNIPKPTDQNSTITNQVWSCALSTDGTVFVAVVGDAILIYDTNNGEMLNKPIRGAHKEQINCVSFS